MDGTLVCEEHIPQAQVQSHNPKPSWHMCEAQCSSKLLHRMGDWGLKAKREKAEGRHWLLPSVPCVGTGWSLHGDMRTGTWPQCLLRARLLIQHDEHLYPWHAQHLPFLTWETSCCHFPTLSPLRASNPHCDREQPKGTARRWGLMGTGTKGCGDGIVTMQIHLNGAPGSCWDRAAAQPGWHRLSPASPVATSTRVLEQH